MYKKPEDINFLNQWYKHFPLAFCNTSLQGTTKASLSQLPDMDSFPSIFHNTLKRKNLSKGEWEKFTSGSTKKAIEELDSSSNFSKWEAANGEKIIAMARSSLSNAFARSHCWWFLWS
ncbi:hypothetical protein PVK06_043478 [Gossypium arboreum]|uniref:Uncharacterized protein n=1 Tax=Gossypium arboreum TaxID=29729 RepID=A0ABR0MNI8_GOSAR|nr:hypothetical protein PVK06_043478 [Gossypium arboreum]